MRIGIAFDLKSDFGAQSGGPEDLYEEYDSEATVAAIEAALRDKGHSPVRLFGGRRFLERATAEKVDLVFNLAEGTGGTRSREAHVPAVCEILKLPHTHSDPLTLAVTLDKGLAKRIAASYGVPTPRFAVIDDARQVVDVELEFPVIAKPLFEGSSMGVRKSSRVLHKPGLHALCTQLLADYKEPVLVEEFCSGPEFTVGVRGNGLGATVLGVMEIVPRLMKPEEFVYSLEVKRNYETEVEYHAPPRRAAETVAAVAKTALGAYRALGCRDLARVDIRIGRDGEPKFLEVNPLPGINPVTGDIVILSRAMGIGYADLIDGVIEAARSRYGL